MNTQITSHEIQFKYTFKKKFNEEEQEKIWNDFIEEIEKHGIYFGGGHNSEYIEGCLDFGNSQLKAKEVALLLKRFAIRNKLISKVKIGKANFNYS